jgi:hypothetical protein
MQRRTRSGVFSLNRQIGHMRKEVGISHMTWNGDMVRIE